MENISLNKQTKLILIGDSFVGKSSILFRYINDKFDKVISSTFGFMFYSKNILKNNSEYTINFWDTNTNEIYNTTNSLFFKNINAAIIVYDCLNKESKKNIFNHIKKIKEKLINKDILIYIVCNKIDKKKDYRENNNFLEKINNYNCKLFYTSAKNNIGINNLFKDIETEMIKIFNNNLVSRKKTIELLSWMSKKNKKKTICFN